MPSTAPRASTGIPGLDYVLGGGFPTGHVYLVEGDPGSGKTTLALQFLREAASRGEPVVYVTLSETATELGTVAASHGWSLTGITIHELPAADAATFNDDDQYTFFHPSEVELGVTMKSVIGEIERVQPTRVVFDSLSEIRLLAREPLRYRRQILGLKQFFSGRDCTVLLLDDRTSEVGDLQLQSLAHGVLSLQQLAPEYGAERRRARIVKLRGSRYAGGYHDFVISTGGVQVFPRLVAAESRQAHPTETASSGLPGLDALWGGGLDRGTSTLLIGPAGVGKSAVATQIAWAAANRGEQVAAYLFDEGLDTFFARAAGLGMDLRPLVDRGLFHVTQVDPAELSPGEFAETIRQAVIGGVSVVVIDSLNGYTNSMPEERFLLAQLHELFAFMRQHGVLAIAVVAQHGMIGSMQSPVDLSYLADNVALFRFFEVTGSVRRAIAILKRRSGNHERSIRELRMDAEGLHLSEPLSQFHGVLAGVPSLSAPQHDEAAADSR